jgi:predicted  nucleic acid-binding Zn-ribbon protein
LHTTYTTLKLEKDSQHNQRDTNIQKHPTKITSQTNHFIIPLLHFYQYGCNPQIIHLSTHQSNHLTMTPSTRSTTTSDTLLQAINNIQDSLQTITSELKTLKTDLNDVQQVVLTLKTDLDDVQTIIKPFPKTVHENNKKVDSAHDDSTNRINILSLQTADLAVELDRLQLLVKDIQDNTNTTSNEFDVDKIVKLTIDQKLLNLPSILRNEIDNCPTIQHLQSSSTTQLHQVLQDIQKQNKYQQ